MQWLDDHTLDFGDVQLDLDYSPSLLTKVSTKERFVLGKAASMIHNLVDLLKDEQVKHMMDLGIYKGGSCVLYERLFQPEKLVAIDIATTPEAALAEYIQQHNLTHRVKLYYGTDQSDYAKLTRIVRDEFQENALDLVVDDASHFFPETRASFNILFPYLRPNGYYLIEDWGWAHWEGDTWQKSGGIWANRPALTNLIVELIMLSASRPDLVSHISLNQNTAVIRRGAGRVEPKGFDLGKLYMARGWKWRPSI
jgi:SAM-dependent methyltransferase